MSRDGEGDSSGCVDRGRRGRRIEDRRRRQWSVGWVRVRAWTRQREIQKSRASRGSIPTRLAAYRFVSLVIIVMVVIIQKTCFGMCVCAFPPDARGGAARRALRSAPPLALDASNHRHLVVAARVAHAIGEDERRLLRGRDALRCPRVRGGGRPLDVVLRLTNKNFSFTRRCEEANS